MKKSLLQTIIKEKATPLTEEYLMVSTIFKRYGLNIIGLSEAT